MRIRTLVLAFVAFGTASGAAMLAKDWLGAQQAAIQAELQAVRAAKPEKPASARILIAARDLPAGSFVREGNLEWVDWPEDAVQDSYFSDEAKGLDDMMGAVIRTGLTAGEPLTAGRVVRPGENGFLAAVLRTGMRAVSVPINATTGISGFVFPGDSVDLLLTQSIKKGQGVRRASETVLRDVRVLAVDQRVSDQDGKAEIGKTVTLEVTPKQTEVIAVAMEMGRLSLALRSLPKEGESEEGEIEPEFAALLAEGDGPSLTWDSQASQAIGGTPRVAVTPKADAPAPQPAPTVKVKIVRGSEAQILAFKAVN